MAQTQIELHPDAKNFGPEVQAILQQLSPSQITYFNALYNKRKKEVFATFLLALVGFDRFYLGSPWTGVIKLLTIPTGIFIIWWLIDLVSLGSRTLQANERIALEVAQQVKNLVDPNAPSLPTPQYGLNWLLILLAAVAFLLLAFAVTLMID